MYRTVKKGDFLDLQGGRAVSKRKVKGGGSDSDSDGGEQYWEYGTDGKLRKVDPKKLKDGGEWFWEYGPNDEKVKYSRPQYMQKYSIDPRVLSQNAGGSKGPFLTKKGSGKGFGRSGQIKYDGSKSMMENPKFKASGPIGSGRDMNRSTMAPRGQLNKSAMSATRGGTVKHAPNAYTTRGASSDKGGLFSSLNKAKQDTSPSSLS
mmetsp:Transcript_22491/g.17003  ORF Transcript_22491/g.17003 Transcript_22491/m.17003 type:complete len:205 (+) Transcript_22491:1405-2019(+)